MTERFMKSAKEYWKDRFGEYPLDDAEKLSVAMMAEYGTIINSEEKSILRELFEMYMVNVNADGEPKASIIDIAELWKRASKIIEC